MKTKEPLRPWKPHTLILDEGDNHVYVTPYYAAKFPGVARLVEATTTVILRFTSGATPQ